MIDKKDSLLLLTLISFFVVISATEYNCDCEEHSETEEDGAYRFLHYTKPLRYQIYIDPCISDGNFSGYVHIDLLVLKPTKNVSLHSQDLEFCEEGVYLTLKGSLNESLEVLKPVTNSEHSAKSFQDSDEMINDSSETVKPNGYVYHKKEQTVTMQFEEFLLPGTYSLEINYIGTIHSNPVGIYRRTYKDLDGENRVMLLTNFFPTSARRIFPCRDEPEAKAEIYFTMQTSLNYTTIMANAPENYVEYKEGQRWMHYHPIANYSTYQLNFAVLSNVKNVTNFDGKRTYVIYSVNSDLKSVKISQDIYEKTLPIMENYTNTPYPLDSFINLMLSDSTNATSSASLGFITTKKSTTVYHERSGPQKKKDIVLQASRNIASQWFNQLISPVSWKYMWMNEGLTEYMKYYLADKVLPNWRLKENFVVWELQRRSFIPNRISDAPALNKNASENLKDVQYLPNQSSTSMGASLIRMMSHFLSENVFQAGIRNFFKTNKHKSIEPNHFWKAIQEAIDNSKDKRLVNISVSAIMSTWMNTEFYPVIKVSRNYTTGLITVSQTPAVKFFGLTEKNVTEKWWIPLNYATKTNPNFNNTFPSHWLKPSVEALEIEGVDSEDWVDKILEPKPQDMCIHTGYYRVLYDERNWKRLAQVLNSDDYHKISPINRAQIINDAVQFALKRHLNMSIFLDLVSYLQRETEYVPWYDAQFIFSFLNYHLSNTQAYESLRVSVHCINYHTQNEISIEAHKQNVILRLIIPLVDKIGYEDRPNDDFSTLMLRRISNHWACHFGYKKCWNNATEQLGAYLNTKKSKLKGSVDLQEWARCVGLNGANETIWNKMLKKYQETLSEYSLIYLACSENMVILNNFLNMTTFNKSILAQERAAFASNALSARLKQTESRILVFDQKANYYEPYLKEKLLQF
ncbi:hypothetical protein TSAR_007330 [Trichomalopsis sarcophagae]|uniref:Aminopeptidase n=1 Tax=Trichomalopsis sarcophagae TaxID=543379 RepID=A0A232FJN7_9HYME|nr:hypothetical protein TSAR_007330 [Trichomalopsis sarcophagae]